MNIVIAGSGVAGVTAAETARRHNPKAYITLFSLEKDLFYYRIRLPEVVSGQTAPEKIFVHPRSWYEDRNIELRLGESLIQIDSREKIIRGSTGSRQTYDRLLLAVGAEANRPSFPGDKLDGIFAVRSLHDAWSLHYYARGKKNAVIIGGGLLGLELGAALASCGLKVTVLEQGERILPRQSTPKSAEILRRQLEAKGLELRLRVQAQRFEGKRQVENILLSDGSDLAAELVVISAGVTPNLSLATSLGLAVDRGIIVDEYLRTSLEGVFAAGDCAQCPGAVGGLWTTSRAQALVAGVNIAASKPEEMKKYIPEPPSNILKVAGVDLTAAGELDAAGQFKGAEAFDDNIYRKVVVDAEGRLIGFSTVGDAKGGRLLQEALNRRAQLDEAALTALGSLDFDLSRL